MFKNWTDPLAKTIACRATLYGRASETDCRNYVEFSFLIRECDGMIVLHGIPFALNSLYSITRIVYARRKMIGGDFLWYINKMKRLQPNNFSKLSVL